jgi:hypothetical protein
VQAVVGEENLRGLDLSASPLVAGSKSASTAVAGVWIVQDRVAEVAVAALRFDDRVAGFLVMGASLPIEALDRISKATGTLMGVLVGPKLGAPTAATGDDRARIEALGATSDTFEARSVSYQGERYLARVREIKGAVPPARTAWMRPEAPSLGLVGTLRLLLWIPLVFAIAFGSYAAWRGQQPARLTH